MSDQGFPDEGGGFGRSDASGPRIVQSARPALRPEEAPPPPRRSRGARNQFVVFLNFVMSMLVFVAVGAAAAVYFGSMRFEERGPLASNTHVMAPQGATISDIAIMLQRRNVITDARIFRLGVRAYMPNGSLKAGEYEIKAGASMHDVMEILRSGRSILHAVTIAEGLSVIQIFNRLTDNPHLAGDLPEDMPPEGSLRPETYKFTRGTTRQEIVDQMRTAQTALIDQIWERRRPDLPIETKEEFVILASIVEKETGRADERPMVASVFINRLERGMRLQSDPTIIYGLFGGAGKPADRPIYRSDINKPTPYNTYVIDGLPPAPIANPGRAALEAVANPSQTDNYYFVADGTGGHAFAETLKEHNANVRRWRQIEAERARESQGADGQ